MWQNIPFYMCTFLRVFFYFVDRLGIRCSVVKIFCKILWIK